MTLEQLYEVASIYAAFWTPISVYYLSRQFSLNLHVLEVQGLHPQPKNAHKRGRYKGGMVTYVALTVLLPASILGYIALISSGHSVPVVQVSSGQTTPSTQSTTAQPLSFRDAESFLIQDIGDRVFFAPNSHELDLVSIASLTRDAKFLLENSNIIIVIAGNTDVDKKSSHELHLEEGNERAEAVSRFLIAKGVSRSRIQTISYGSDCPVAEGFSKVSDYENRNAIISVQGYNGQKCSENLTVSDKLIDVTVVLASR